MQKRAKYNRIFVMSILFILFLIYMIKKEKIDTRRSSIFRGIAGLTIGLTVLSVVLSILESVDLGFLAVAGMIIYAVYKSKQKKQEEERSRQAGWNAENWDKQRGNTDTRKTYEANRKVNKKEYTSSGTIRGSLPSSVAKRRKIVQAFNVKYELCLTDTQVNDIVNATYFSEIWYKEVEAMNAKYHVVHEWFVGYTGWLRVYMYAFHIQDITSDIRQQENIAMYAFEEIFKYSDSLDGFSQSQRINAINQKFYTSFDDNSYMLAYRFLESKGLKHELGNPEVVRVDSTIEDLMNKYGEDSETQSSTMSTMV